MTTTKPDPAAVEAARKLGATEKRQFFLPDNGLVTINEVAAIIDSTTHVGELREALAGLVNWCRHPSHGGLYSLPKPLEPYLIRVESMLAKLPKENA